MKRIMLLLLALPLFSGNVALAGVVNSYTPNNGSGFAEGFANGMTNFMQSYQATQQRQIYQMEEENDRLHNENIERARAIQEIDNLAGPPEYGCDMQDGRKLLFSQEEFIRVSQNYQLNCREFKHGYKYFLKALEVRARYS